MATKHWVRDVLLTDTGDYTAGGNHNRANALLYHFLKNAGFDWQWECDGDGGGGHVLNPNHVDDGNMDETGAPTKYVATGSASIQKVTTPVRSGSQALEVDPSLGAGGVVTTALNSMVASTLLTGLSGCSLSAPDAYGNTIYDHNANISGLEDNIGRVFVISGSSQPQNNGEFPIVDWSAGDDKARIYNPSAIAESYTTGVYEVSIAIRAKYELVLYVANNGPALDVSVDPGTGSPVLLGTIPNNGGVSTRYHFAFTVDGSGDVLVYVERPSADVPFYIDSMNVFRSMFEYMHARDESASGADTSHYPYTGGIAVNHYGVDGVLTNPDQFSTGVGDNYSPGSDDVGKHLVIWDPVNNKNSGIYEIIADVGGGVVQVNLRSGTATFTNATGLRWRIISVQQYNSCGMIPNKPMPGWQQSAGYGIESPHTSKWRFFLRQNQGDGQTVKSSEMWSAPEDTDFDQSTGHFYLTGPSVMRSRVREWTRNVGGSGTNPYMHTWRGYYSYSTADTITRLFIMTDEELSFFHFLNWDGRAPGTNHHGTFLVGYHQPDPDHPGIMAFVHMARWETIGTAAEFYWDSSPDRFSYYGTCFDRYGVAQRCLLAQIGYGTGAGTVIDIGVAQPNPWSGEEWLHELRIINDPVGDAGVPSMRDAGPDFGVYEGRSNLPDLSTFDNNGFLHFRYGLVWEWMGESLVP